MGEEGNVGRHQLLWSGLVRICVRISRGIGRKLPFVGFIGPLSNRKNMLTLQQHQPSLSAAIISRGTP